MPFSGRSLGEAGFGRIGRNDYCAVEEIKAPFVCRAGWADKAAALLRGLNPCEELPCKSAPGDVNAKCRMGRFFAVRHGNLMLVPEAEPSAMQLLLDFLKETVG
ncbi:MAG: hypothetical protein JW929_08870 [Anaerolineales bacterium]|nr:hypothetical protein [Anaerolineales bacterium]